MLLSGHHAEIARWRRAEAIRRTARRRPDLLATNNVTPAEWAIADNEGGKAGEREGGKDG